MNNLENEDEKTNNGIEKKLNLLIGRSGTGKTTEILERVKEDIEKDKEAFLIIPEQFSYSFEKKITDSFSSVLNLQILSFSRLIEHILNDSKFKNKTYIDDISRSIILEKILDRLDLQILKNKEKNIEAISNMIEEFKKYDVKETDLKTYIDIKKEEGVNLSLIKLEEIYNIYSKYNEEIEDKYLDIADKEFEVLKIIEEKQIFKNKKIYIDQFAKFTHGNYQIIDKMLKQALEVNIAITSDSIHKKSEYEVFSTTKRTISELIQLAQFNNVKTNIIELKENLKHKNDLKNLELTLFEETTVSESIEDNITLRVYKNIEDEVEDIAESIMEEIISKGYKYSDIAVIYNDLENQENLIRRIFNKYNMPIILNIDKKLNQNSMAKYILALLEIIHSNYSIESVLSFLKLGYSDFNIEDVYQLERYIYRWKIRGSKWKNEWKNYDQLDEENFNKLIELKDSFVKFIEEIKSNLKRNKTAKDISLVIFNVIQEQEIFVKAIENIDKLNISDVQKLELKNEYSVSLNLLIETLDRIVSIKQDDIISYEKYYDIFKLILKETSIKQIPSTNDAIEFTTSKTLSMDDIKSLYIISLDDGLYPILPSYKGLISDEEKLVLRANNINLSETDIERLADDEYNMYSIFLIPSDALHLSYHMSALTGESKRLSIYINKIKRRLKYLEEEIRIKGLYKENITAYSDKVLLEKVLSKYLEHLEGKSIEDEWKYLIHILQNKSEEFRIIEKNILDKNIAPKLSMDLLEKVFRENMYTSVSRLEEYAKCPFSYFARYTLALKEDDKYEISPLNTGILLHDVLNDFVEMIKDKKISLDEINSKLLFLPDKESIALRSSDSEYREDYTQAMSDIEEITDKIIDEKLEDDKYKMFMFSPKFKFLTDKFRGEIKKATKMVLESLRLSDFSVLGSEINIGSDFKKSKYPLKNNKYTQIYGQIDRADIFELEDKTYLRIVDYKSSDQDLDENKIRGGLQLQLLTYLDVLAKEKDYLPSGTLYLGLTPSINSISIKSEAEIEKASQFTYKMKGIVLDDEKVIRAMDKSLENGHSDILPVAITKDGKAYTNSKVKDEEGFEELREIVSDHIVNMSEEILQGDISILPYKYKQETGCRFCPYRNICQFDIKKNRYRRIDIINKKKDNEKQKNNK